MGVRWAAIAIIFCSGAAHAGEPPSAHAAVALVAGWSEGPGERLAGLRFAMAPGWKTYWRSPGEAGVPPVFDWSGSQNLASVEVAWPAPEIFDTYGMMTLGYADAVTLPLRVTATDPAAPVSLRLALDYGVCSDICILQKASLALDIAPDAPASGVAEVQSGLARAPQTAEEAGLIDATCTLAGAGEDRAFDATLHFAAPWSAAPLVVVEGPPGVWFAPAQVQAEGGALHVTTQAQVYDGPGWVARDAVRMTVLGRGADGAPTAVDVQGCARARG